MVTDIATIGFDLRRTSRNRAVKVTRQHQDGEHHHGLQSAQRVEPGEEYVAQPFPREPRSARLGEREDVAHRNPAVGENPFAGPDVPAGIAIAEQRLHAFHPPEEKRDGHEEGEVRQRRQQLHGELGTRFHFMLRPSRNWRPAACFKRANPVVKRPEIHIIHAQGDQRKILGGIRSSRITVPWQ